MEGASGGLCLVTGGSGFAGSRLVEKLIGRGQAVRVFDLEDSEDRPDKAEFIRGDIRDLDAVRRACQGAANVYHCVATVPVAKDASMFWSVNREGTGNLVRASFEAGVSKLVHISSSAVYGAPESNPVDEDTAPCPAEEYGRAKLAGEDLCREYAKKGLDVTIIRSRTIMGPGRLGIMQVIFEWAYKGRNLPVLGRGDNLYQFVHADDLCDACIKAAEKEGPALYNVGAEDFCTMRETLEGLAAHACTGSRVVSLHRGLATAAMRLTSALGLSPLGPYHFLMYGRSLYFDLAKAMTELDWQPVHGNVEMFCEAYDWYAENREQVLRKKTGPAHRSPVRHGALSVAGRMLGLLG